MLNAADGGNNRSSVGAAGARANLPHGNSLGAGQTFEKLSSGFRRALENNLRVQRHRQGAGKGAAVSAGSERWGSPNCRGNDVQRFRLNGRGKLQRGQLFAGFLTRGLEAPAGGRSCDV